MPRAPSRGTHMTRIGLVSSALLGLSISVAFSTAAMPDNPCLLWNLHGEWTFVQSNNTSPIFTLRQTNTGLQGSARYSGPFGEVRGSVDGESKGDQFKVTAYWDNETTGVYEGTISPTGRISGRTHDAQHPNVVANWYSNRTARCFDVQGDALNQSGNQSSPPPVPQKPPLKAQERVQTGTPGPKLTICEAAWKARARNSPAAPGLEAQCRAAGGTPTAPN